MFIDSLEAIQAIESKRNNHSDLNKFKEIMNELNNPQDSIKSIHIAGTNGKGSTTDFIRSILQSAGYKVGTFTSPYLISHHDRIRINNVNIDDQRLLDYINQTKVFPADKLKKEVSGLESIVKNDHQEQTILLRKLRVHC